VTAGHRIDPPVHTIDSYLRELRSSLRGPAGWRRRVLIETEEGLRADFAAARDQGEPVTEGEIVRDWGSPGEIAAEFNESARRLRARHMAVRIMQLLLPAIPGWALTVWLSPDPWPTEPVLVMWFVPVLFASVVAAIVGATRLIRSGTAGESVDPVSVVCAGVGVAAGMVAILVLFFYRLQAANGHFFWPTTIYAGLLSVTLLVLVVSDLRHLSRSALVTGRSGRRPA
jgi:hypothetical protein